MKSLSSLAIGLIICSGIYLGAEEPVPSIQRGQVWKDLSTIQLKRGDSLLIDCAKMHDGSILFHILHFYDKTTEKPLALVRQPVILGADTVENVSIGPVMGYADGKVELSFLNLPDCASETRQSAGDSQRSVCSCSGLFQMDVSLQD